MSAKFDPATKHFAALQVLIVDDLFIMRELIAGICAGIGFQHVTTCDSGKEALRQLQAGKFDLVIIDEKLEAESGLSLVRAIRTIKALSTIRVLVVTASCDYKVAILAKRAGADDFLLKPFRPEVLRERLLKLLPSQ